MYGINSIFEATAIFEDMGIPWSHTAQINKIWQYRIFFFCVCQQQFHSDWKVTTGIILASLPVLCVSSKLPHPISCGIRYTFTRQRVQTTA